MGIAATVSESVKYLRNVRAEVRRVTWQTWPDLRQHTVAVIIVVTIVGIIIGLMDWFFSFTLIRVLGNLIR